MLKLRNWKPCRRDSSYGLIIHWAVPVRGGCMSVCVCVCVCVCESWAGSGVESGFCDACLISGRLRSPPPTLLSLYWTRVHFCWCSPRERWPFRIKKKNKRKRNNLTRKARPTPRASLPQYWCSCLTSCWDSASLRRGNHFRVGSCHFGSECVSCFERMHVPVALRWNWGAAKVVDRSAVSAALARREGKMSEKEDSDFLIFVRVCFVRVCCELDQLDMEATITIKLNATAFFFLFL